MMMTTPTTAKKPRLKQLKRAPEDQRPRIRLSQRDLKVIEAVYTHRALTTDQVEDLFFASDPSLRYGKKTWCQNRLKLLYHNGFLFRDEQPRKMTDPRKPFVYFLDEKGAQALCEYLGLEPEEINWQPDENQVSHLFLDHLLKINQVRVAIEVAVQGEVQLVQWVDDRTLQQRGMKDYVTLKGPQGGERKRAAIADSYFHLQRNGYDFHFLLEADRGTVVGEYTKWGRRDWAEKIKTYLAYYASGLYQKRWNTTSLRILTVTTTPRRLETLKRITEEAGGKGRFWFTTFDQIKSSTVLFDPIWQRAGFAEPYTLLKPSETDDPA